MTHRDFIMLMTFWNILHWHCKASPSRKAFPVGSLKRAVRVAADCWVRAQSSLGRKGPGLAHISVIPR